jgi:hypothetical protein
MTPKRIAAGTLSLVLLALLIWSIVADVGDLKTKVLLAVGFVLGSIYTGLGRIPTWIIDLFSGSITDDDDPSNISPRVYLPIILGVILIGVIVTYVAMFVM